MDATTNTINAPKIEDLIAAHKRTPMRPAKPPGCWDLPGLSGSRDGVCRVIREAAGVPQFDKEWLCRRIEGLDPKFNHVVLSAYCHEAGGVQTVDVSIKPSTQLV